MRSLCPLVAVAFVVATCGGGASGSDDTGPDAIQPARDESATDGSGTEADLERAATDSFMAFVTNDYQAYFNSLSRECREKLEYAAVEAHLQGRRFTAAEIGGIDLSDLGVGSAEISGLSGGTGNVILEITGTDELFREGTPQNWVFEEGEWHLDECSDIGEAQGGLEGQGVDRSDPLDHGAIADVNGWLVVVTFIEPNGESLVLEMGGDVAAEGNQLFNAQLSITYNGVESSVTIGEELGFAMVNGDTVYGDESSCELADSGGVFLDPTIQLGPGDSPAPPTICREVAIGDVEGLLLRVTHIPTGDNFWFDLATNG